MTPTREDLERLAALTAKLNAITACANHETGRGGWLCDHAANMRDVEAQIDALLAASLPAPDVEVLSKADAFNLECLAGDLAADDEWDRFGELVLGVARKIRATLANGAGEVERLRADLLCARNDRTLAQAHGIRLREERNNLRDETVRLGDALIAAENERDQLRADLGTLRSCHAQNCKALADADETIGSLRAELDEARRELGEAVANGDDHLKRLNRWWDWATRHAPNGSADAKRAAIDAKLAAAKAGVVVTEDDVRWVRHAARHTYPSEAARLTDVADRLSQLAQPREAGK